MAKPCLTYCSHGGICELDDGHEGLHTTRYCWWTDADSVDHATADEILRQSGSPDAEFIIALWGIVDPADAGDPGKHD